MIADWKRALLLALPLFIVAMWYGISQRFEDIGLFAVAMAVATFHVAEMALLTYRRFREWREQVRNAETVRRP